MTQLQVFARPCGIVLCSHWVLHSLDVLLEVVQRAENVLHALAVIHEETGGVRLHVAGAFGLLGWLDGQWLDDLTGRTLRNAIKMFEEFRRANDVISNEESYKYSLEDREDQPTRCLPLALRYPGRNRNDNVSLFWTWYATSKLKESVDLQRNPWIL